MILGGKKVEHKMCVLALSTNFVRSISQHMIKNIHWFSCKVVVILVGFKKKKRIFSTDF